MANPQDENVKMVAEDNVDPHLINPPQMIEGFERDKIRIFKVKRVKQMARPDSHPGELPPVPKDFERIFTIRGINDGRQTYSEYAILDVEPDFAVMACEEAFFGQYNHTGEALEQNAKRHELRRAVRFDEYMAQFTKKAQTQAQQQRKVFDPRRA